MLLTTFIIDYKVVLTAECKASDKLDMNKIVFSPASFPPSFQLFWRQPPAKDFLCFNLQYTHLNLINTVAVRNGDHIGWVTGHLYHAAILLCVLCLSIILLTRRKYLLWEILYQWNDAHSLRAIGQPSKHLSNVIDPLHCLEAMVMVWELSVLEKIEIKTNLYLNTINFHLGCTLVHFANHN